MRKSSSSLLLGGVALAAVLCAAPAAAQETPSTEEAVEEVTTPLSPRYGTIGAFYGNIDPFYGKIDPFYGTINPFYGNITSFWGTINPFYGNITSFWGTINPFYGNIGAFDGTRPAIGDIGRYWEQFGTFWQESAPLYSDPLKAPELAVRFSDILARSELMWGAAVKQATGKTFMDGVAKPLFLKYGIDPAVPSTLQNLSTERRAQFFLDWYDSLMGYSGTDRVDHWMRAVNWTPAITQQQGSGARSIIGLIDATATGDPDLADNIVYSGGGTAIVGGHGVGVASLMVAAHDRAGVVGIAPNATVVAYNPFDATNTASFKAVKDGIITLGNRGASVINMSLGVPGYTLHPDWRKLFSDSSVSLFADPAVVSATHGKVTFVMAAGNDGKVQTDNIRWDWSKAPALIIVGSVDMSGKISNFSNTPGTACMLDGTHCYEQNRLMNIFMVAPGELILLPDGQGGFVRRSGTSFAAPLVSGAITLLHDRWPWLAKHPRETVEIMLRSARDLGAPGIDPVYGRGMLDVAASQAPLNFDALKFYEVRNGVMTAVSGGDVRAGGIKTTWEAEGVYFHLYETIGSTFRDFTVPLSSSLVGKAGTLTGSSEYFQRFIEQRLRDWIGGTGGFTDVATIAGTPAAGWQASLSAKSPYSSMFRSAPARVPHSSMRIAHDESGVAFAAGSGEGALAMNALAGMELSSDYASEGGVNPLLGLASGDSFANVEMKVARGTLVSVGVTSQEVDHSRMFDRSEEERRHYDGVDNFNANALNVRVTHRPGANVTVSASYARVNEKNSLLGVQSRMNADLDHGAVSDTLTVGASAELPRGLTLALTATGGRTQSNAEQGLSTKGSGVLSSAFALALTKTGVLSSSDRMRVSVAQPLHIEKGELAYSSVQVVDRQTGELGLVEQRFGIGGGTRAYRGELIYASPVFGNAGELGFFGRADLKTGESRVDEFAMGARLKLGF